MSTRLAIWDDFCHQHGILEKPTPLFAADEGVVRLLPFGTQKVLQRSAQMEALVIQETTKVVDDYKQGADVLEGLIYMMYWVEGARVIPLYIGRTEKYGRKGGNLSANIANPRDKARFSRWGYNPYYHIGALSAALLESHSKGNYGRWAEVLFETTPSQHPRLNRETYFWISAWRAGTVGPWKELGATPLTSLEYLLIALAGALFPDHLLNVEGINRGKSIKSSAHEMGVADEPSYGQSALLSVQAGEITG